MGTVSETIRRAENVFGAPVVIFHKDHRLDPAGVNAGAETATIQLARALVLMGHRVFVAAQLPPGFVDLLQASGGEFSDKVTYIDFGSNFDTKKAFREIEETFGVIDYHLIVASRAQALLESVGNSRIISRLFISHEPSAKALGAEPRLIGEVADKVIAVSVAQRDGLVEAGCNPKKIAVVPNGANLEVFYPGDNSKRDFNRIAFVGALVIDKGVHILLEAFSRVVTSMPNLKLDIYGSAQLWGRENYFDIEQAKRIPGVTFHGAVPQRVVAEAFRTSGLLVLPSIFFDSFPLTAVEAQVSGLPVLGSLNGGMKEIIRDGVTGRLLGNITVESLADELSLLMSQPAMLRSMSAAAFELIRPNFSWLNTAASIMQLMSELTSGREAQVLDENKVEENHTQSSASAVSNKLEAAIDFVESEELPRIAFLTTWNQRCGLATYAKHLLSEIGSDKVTIISEESPASGLMGKDEPNVFRVWKRRGTDFTRLAAVLDSKEIEVLHLNCHYRFFNGTAFARFLEQRRAQGLKVIAHIHTTFTVDPDLQALVSAVDEVIVHYPENRLEAIANGAIADRVTVIDHGVKVSSGLTQSAARRALGISASQKMIVTFGFIQPHKGIDEVITALQALTQKYPDSHLYIVGGPHHEDQSSVQYLNGLKQLTSQLGLASRVHFSDCFSPESQVENYLVAADAVVMNYRSQYYEASGAVSHALGCGAVIITSSAPAFANLGDAVFHVTAGYPLTIALDAVLGNPRLSAELRNKARALAEERAWPVVANKFRSVWCAVGIEARRATQQTVLASAQLAKVRAQEEEAERNSRARQLHFKKQLRVLMQIRPNALTHRGGDTVVMERIAEGLREEGAFVEIDVNGTEDVRRYDIVQLYNFATPEITEAQARRCVEAGVPYAVYTAYEDLPLFFNQMIAQFRAVQAYVKAGQPKAAWADLIAAAKNIKPSPRWENSWTASNAAALIATGARETLWIKRDYPDARFVQPIRLGCEVSVESDQGELFIKEFGFSNFVLCVGRLETRKNQLMLLKALEDSELTVVFATGGFTYQPEYEEACKNFKRVGKTVFLGRLDSKMLASAYAAARVHALPSWFELPGLVSLEAARRGTNVVVTDYGTARDYFGDLAYYCKPDDAESIRAAVQEAYDSPSRPGLAEEVRDCSWKNSAKQVMEIYQQVLNDLPLRRSTYELPEWKDMSANEHVTQSIERASDTATRASESVAKITEAVVRDNPGQASVSSIRLCNEGDIKCRDGLLDEAKSTYMEALRIAPDCARAFRSIGVVALRQDNSFEAEVYFNRALRIDPTDAKSLAGLGASKWTSGKTDEAFEIFRQTLKKYPNETSVLLHFVNASYSLSRYTELEEALRNYLIEDPKNKDILYCLAGCYFKQEKNSQSLEIVERILALVPEDRDALELKQVIESRIGAVPAIEQNGLEAKPLFCPPAISQAYAGSFAGDNSIPSRLKTLEKLKQGHDYSGVIEGADSILSSSEANPDQRALAAILRAEAMAYLGKLTEADAEFKIAESNSTYRHRALTGRGAVAAAMERFADAEAHFNHALKIQPTSDVAIAGLGVCSMQKGDNLEGWDYFQKALTLNSENNRAILGVIQLAYPLGKLIELEKILVAYLDMHPANLGMLYAYAGCCYAQGRAGEAREQLLKIQIFDPQHKLAQELLQQIESDGLGAGTASQL